MLDRLSRRLAVSGGVRSRRLNGGMAAIAVVGLFAGGCGSSSSTSSSASTAASAPALTKAQFVAQANAICVAGNKKLKATEKSFSGSLTEAQLKTFATGTFAPEVQRQIDAINALAAPTAEQAEVTHFMGLAQAALNEVKSNPDLLAGKSSPFHEFGTVAHAYGLTACAEDT